MVFILILLLVSVQYISTTILDTKFEVTNIDHSIWIVNRSTMVRSIIHCSLMCLNLDECEAFKFDRSYNENVCEIGLFNGSFGINVSFKNITVFKKALPQTTTVSSTTSTTTTTTSAAAAITATSIATAEISTTLIEKADTATFTTTNVTTATTTMVATTKTKATTSSTSTTTTITTTTTSTITTTTITTSCIKPPDDNERQNCLDILNKVNNKVFIQAKAQKMKRGAAKEECKKMSCRLPSLQSQDEINAARMASIDETDRLNAFWLDLGNNPVRDCIGQNCFNNGNRLNWGGCDNVEVELFSRVQMYAHDPSDSNKEMACTKYAPEGTKGIVESVRCLDEYMAVCMCMC